MIIMNISFLAVSDVHVSAERVHSHQEMGEVPKRTRPVSWAPLSQGRTDLDVISDGVAVDGESSQGNALARN